MKVKMLLVFVMGLGLSGLSHASASNTLNVSSTYQKSVQVAWNKASEGELPVYECASVVGTASKMVTEKKDKNNEAQQAYKACYVDVFLNYTDAFFALRDNAEIADDNKPRGCPLYNRYLKAHTTSLTAYADRFNLNTDDLNNLISEGLSETASLCQSAFE